MRNLRPDQTRLTFHPLNSQGVATVVLAIPASQALTNWSQERVWALLSPPVAIPATRAAPTFEVA